MAQLVGCRVVMREVVSSSPAGPSLRVLNNRIKIVAFVIDHFRITFGLFFKASLGAHPFIGKLVLIHMQIKTNFHMKR